MQEETRERWRELCEQAATEQNPEKFDAIIRELNDVLEQKELRLKEAHRLSGEQRTFVREVLLKALPFGLDGLGTVPQRVPLV